MDNNIENLIVPIDIQAMCINDEEARFVNQNYLFDKLQNEVNPLKEQKPFLSEHIISDDNSSQNLSKGIHLHWALPDSLTHAVKTETEVVFPKVPNRWIITRINKSETSKSVKSKQWLIESDFLSEVSSNGTIAIPYKFKDTTFKKYLGKVTEVTDNNSLNNNTTSSNKEDYFENLTAIGYGIPEFAASYLESKSIFGFYDDYSNLKDGLYSYHIVGFYCDKLKNALTSDQSNIKKLLLSNEEPLNELKKILAAYNWSIPNEEDEIINNWKEGKSEMFFSGMISNVIWQAQAEIKNYFEEIKSEEIKIAVGNTHEEAMSALIGPKNNEIDQKNLKNIQLGLFQKFTNPNNINEAHSNDEELFKQTFNSIDAGSIWQIMLINKEVSTKSSNEILNSISNDIVQKLDELNKKEHDIQKLKEVVSSIQLQIYLYWRLYIKNPYTDSQEVHRDYISAKIEDLNGKLENKSKEEATRNVLEEDIKKLLTKYDCELIQLPAKNYWQAKDPVVLMSGGAIQPTQRYGGDGEYRSNNTLVCRLTSQLNKKVKIYNEEIDPSKYFNNFYKGSESSIISAIISDLLVQDPLFIFSINGGELTELKNAVEKYINPDLQHIKPDQLEEEYKDLYIKYFKENQKDISLKLQEKNWKKDLHYHVVSKNLQTDSILKYSGIAISQVGWNFWEKNPWLPFYFKWNANYYPTSGYKDKDIINENILLKNYTQQVDSLELINKDSFDIKYDLTYKNKFVLSPHAKKILEENIKKEVGTLSLKSNELNESLYNLLNYTENLDETLSQSLFGLTEEFLQMSNAMQFLVAQYDKDIVNFSNVDVRNAVGEITLYKLNTQSDFFPIRAGLLKLNKLTIMDVFGRNIDIDITKINVIESLKTKIEKTNEDNGYIHLAPRFVQPTRLLANWINSEGYVFNQLPAGNPIFAYLLPNFLDKSIWIYSNNGEGIGTIELNNKEDALIWNAIPIKGLNISSQTSVSDFKSSTKYNKLYIKLQKIITYLSDINNFKKFLNNVESGIAASLPDSTQHFFGPSFFQGTPIAVADIELKFDIMGLPARSYKENELDAEINKFDDDNKYKVNAPYNSTLEFEKVKVPITLGDHKHSGDGLLAYSLNGFTDVKYITEEQNLSLALADEPIKVSIFFDPRNKIKIKTNVLPINTMALPPYIYGEVLDKMQLAFEVAPILSNEDQLTMPLPDMPGFAWDWLAVENDSFIETNDIKPLGKEFSETAFNELQEGWIKLVNIKNNKNGK